MGGQQRDIDAFPGGPVLGRTQECARLDSLIGSGPGVILEGDLGIGKTTLLRWARERARARGCTVLTADAVEFEVAWEYGAWADLFAAVPDGVVRSLPAATGRTIDVALLGREVPSRALDPRAVAHAVLDVLRALSAEAPVVLSIDDLQWVDPASQRLLGAVLRRARDLPVRVLGAVRTGFAGTDGSPFEWEVAAGGFERLRVSALAEPALRALSELRLQRAPTPYELAWIVDRCAGNPLFALELVGVLAREGHVPDHVDGPAALRDFVRRRVAGLPKRARDILLVSALLGDAPIGDVVAAAGRPGEALAAIDEALTAGLLVEADRRVDLFHPLARAVVVEEAPPAMLRAGHRRVADRSADPEVRLRHRALGAEGVDELLAAEVESAASAVARRGAPIEAAGLAHLASVLTPPEHDSARTRRIAAEAEYRFLGGEIGAALRLAEPLLPSVPPGAERVALVRQVARYGVYAGESMDQWITRLLTAIDEAGADDRQRADLLLDAAIAAANGGRTDVVMPLLLEIRRLATDAGDERLLSQLAGGEAWLRFTLGEGLRRDLCAQGVAVEQPSDLPVERNPLLAVAHTYSLADEFDAARVLYDDALAAALAEERHSAVPLIVWGLSELEIATGNWERARSLLEMGRELAVDMDLAPATIVVSGLSGRLRALGGDVDAGIAEARAAVDAANAAGWPFGVFVGAHALGVAELSRDDPAAAHANLAPVVEQVLAAGLPEPGLCHFVADDVEALVRLGDLDAAEALLDVLERRSLAVDRAWGLAASARCRALLATMRGDLVAATSAIDEAFVHHDRLGMPLERGRTLLVAGEVHRRARRKRRAADAYAEALATFDGLGAPLWAHKAQEATMRAGIRPPGRADESLTAAEARVVQLAVEGLDNAEIGAKLFMARRTVQSHLSKAYRKLGVRNRTELASRFKS